jgi:hypothetical protein
MMFLLWLAVAVGFWGAFIWFTRGAPTRHLAFLHFAVFFFAIYLSSHAYYAEHGSTNTRFIASVMAYPVLAFIGMWLAQHTHGRTDFSGTTIRRIESERWFVIAIVAFFLTIYAIYLRSLGDNIPLLVLLRGAEPVESRVARFLATKGYEGALGGYRLFLWLSRELIDYLSSFVIVFAYYWARDRKRGYGTFGVVFSLMAVLAVLQVEKHPAMRLAAVLAVCHFNFANRRIGLKSFRTGLSLIGVSIVFAGIVYGMVSGAFRQLSGASMVSQVVATAKLGQELLSERGQVGQMLPLYNTYELVPKTYDYFGGRTLTNPHGILPYKHVTWPYILFAAKHQTDEGVTGSDPTTFFGEIYVNWGLTFSMLFMLLFGYLLQVLHHNLSRNIDRIGSTFDYAFFYLVGVYMMDFALGFSVPWFDDRIFTFAGIYLFRKYVILPRVSGRGVEYLSKRPAVVPQPGFTSP